MVTPSASIHFFSIDDNSTPVCTLAEVEQSLYNSVEENQKRLVKEYTKVALEIDKASVTGDTEAQWFLIGLQNP